ncbi:hypothetical protein PIB30_056884 [Stylosanthes scabra]|nr:hypothetical protein [Stylosanthes scabra]
MDPPKKEEEVEEEAEEEEEEEEEATLEMDKGKSAGEPEGQSYLVRDAAETAARLIAEAEHKEELADQAFKEMKIAQDLAEESIIQLQVLKDIQQKTSRGEKVHSLNDDQGNESQKDDKDK